MFGNRMEWKKRKNVREKSDPTKTNKKFKSIFFPCFSFLTYVFIFNWSHRIHLPNRWFTAVNAVWKPFVKVEKLWPSGSIKDSYDQYLHFFAQLMSTRIFLHCLPDTVFYILLTSCSIMVIDGETKLLFFFFFFWFIFSSKRFFSIVLFLSKLKKKVTGYKSNSNWFWCTHC